MFGLDEVKYEHVITRFQSLPKCELKERYKDSGSGAAKYLLSTLNLWRDSHIQYAKSGALLAQSISRTNKLTAYLGLRETKQTLVELEPWQVCDHLGVRSNFDLIVAMERYPFLDDEGLLPEAHKQIGYSSLWAVAICHLAEGANINSLIHAYISFAEALRAENFFKHAKLVDNSVPWHKAFLAQEERRRKFVRLPDKRKEQVLREKTAAYRKKRPTRSRNDAANILSKDKSIGLGMTRIKEYFELWYTRYEWPRSPTGRRPKQSA